MNSLNTLLTRIGALLLAPFESYPVTGLVLWGAVSGVIATYLFGRTSSQRRLAEAADQTRAQLLAIRLFKDDLGVTFRCQLELLKATGKRLIHSVPPMVVMLIPFVFVLTQLAVWYEHAPLDVGEPVIVQMELTEDAWPALRNTKLESPAEIAVETESLRDDAEHTLCWRVRPQNPGHATLSWKLDGKEFDKDLAVADDASLMCVSPRRPGSGFWDRLLHPAEAGFSTADPVRSIDVQHATRQSPIFGLDVPWWATFLIASIVAALLVRRFLGVTF